MLKISFCRASIAALTSLGLLLSTPHVQAGGQQSGQKLTVQHTDAKLLDIGLKDGTLHGRVVDQSGAPAANAPVVVRQGHQEIAKTATNAQGQFACAGLKGGVYEVASGQTVGAYRVWQEAAAPPSAKEQALLVLGRNGERGQFGAIGGGMLLIAGIAVAALALSIIAIKNSNDSNDSGLNSINNQPQSN